MQDFINIVMGTIFLFIFVRILFFEYTIIQISFENSKRIGFAKDRITNTKMFFAWFFVIKIYNCDMKKYYELMTISIEDFDRRHNKGDTNERNT